MRILKSTLRFPQTGRYRNSTLLFSGTIPFFPYNLNPANSSADFRFHTTMGPLWKTRFFCCGFFLPTKSKAPKIPHFPWSCPGWQNPFPTAPPSSAWATRRSRTRQTDLADRQHHAEPFSGQGCRANFVKILLRKQYFTLTFKPTNKLEKTCIFDHSPSALKRHVCWLCDCSLIVHGLPRRARLPMLTPVRKDRTTQIKTILRTL